MCRKSPNFYRVILILMFFRFEVLNASNLKPEFTLMPIALKPVADGALVHGRNGSIKAKAKIEVKDKTSQTWSLVFEGLQVEPMQFFSWQLKDLQSGIRYQFKVTLSSVVNEKIFESQIGEFVTQRQEASSFKVALIADSHIGPFKDKNLRLATLKKIVSDAAKHEPDFFIALGDNVGWPGSKRSVSDTKKVQTAYQLYREVLFPLTNTSSYFGVIGNWEGENGIIPIPERIKAINIRKRYLPGADHETYKQGGSLNQDYYAFNWGEALFIVLNVQSYSVPSLPANEIDEYLEVARMSDWTLGTTQLAWFKKNLEESRQKYKFVFIHHTVGGMGGNERETLYGRGGARAYDKGEQKVVHEFMKKFGVQAFFYGHDHVFTDEVVDGIHYTLPGVAGMPVKFSKSWTGYERFWKLSGYGLLDVRSEKATVTFFDEDGKNFYSYEMKPYEFWDETVSKPTSNHLILKDKI